MCPKPLYAAASFVFLSTFALSTHAQTATQQPASAPAPAAAPNAPATAPDSKAAAKPAAAKKVWTNEDMNSLNGPTYEATPSPATRPNSNRPRYNPGAPDGSYFRNQIASLRTRIADIDKKIDNFESLAHGEAPGQGEKQTGVRITDNRADIQALEKQREALEKQISDLEDQARHAGVEPGQLR